MCLSEGGIAILFVICTIILVAGVNHLIGLLSPDTSLTPRAISNIAAAPDKMYAYGFILFSLTFAPVAEEMFFRGFLYNAFRDRMPLIAAVVVQSFLFGFGHFFGAMHASIAFLTGLMLTALYQWRQTLIAPILAHTGINLIAALSLMSMMAAHANSPALGVIGKDDDTRCVIREVAKNSTAEDANLRAGDVITSLDNEPIRDIPHLSETLRRHKPGDEVTMTVDRLGVVFDVTVVLRRRAEWSSENDDAR